MPSISFLRCRGVGRPGPVSPGTGLQRCSALLGALLLAPLLAPLLGGCASTGSDSGPGRALRVTLIDYPAKTRFELVSRTHTDPVEYYSSPRPDASRKIIGDDAAVALVEHLEDQGFAKYRQAGSAPADAAGGRFTRGLEIEDEQGVSFLATGKGSPTPAREAMVACTVSFLAVYQEAQSFQTVENASGSSFFGSPGSR